MSGKACLALLVCTQLCWSYESAPSREWTIRAASWIVIIKAKRVPRWQGELLGATVVDSIAGAERAANLTVPALRTSLVSATRLRAVEQVGDAYLCWLQERKDGSFRVLDRCRVRQGNVEDPLYGHFDRRDYTESVRALKLLLAVPPAKVRETWGAALANGRTMTRLVLLRQIAYERWRGETPLPCLAKMPPEAWSDLSASCVSLASTENSTAVRVAALRACGVTRQFLSPGEHNKLARLCRDLLQGDARSAALGVLARMSDPVAYKTALSWLADGQDPREATAALSALRTLLRNDARFRTPEVVRLLMRLLENEDLENSVRRGLRWATDGQDRKTPGWRLWWSKNRHRYEDK